MEIKGKETPTTANPGKSPTPDQRLCLKACEFWPYLLQSDSAPQFPHHSQSRPSYASTNSYHVCNRATLMQRVSQQLPTVQFSSVLINSDRPASSLIRPSEAVPFFVVLVAEPATHTATDGGGHRGKSGAFFNGYWVSCCARPPLKVEYRRLQIDSSNLCTRRLQTLPGLSDHLSCLALCPSADEKRCDRRSRPPKCYPPPNWFTNFCSCIFKPL